MSKYTRLLFFVVILQLLDIQNYANNKIFLNNVNKLNIADIDPDSMKDINIMKYHILVLNDNDIVFSEFCGGIKRMHLNAQDRSIKLSNHDVRGVMNMMKINDHTIALFRIVNLDKLDKSIFLEYQKSPIKFREFLDKYYEQMNIKVEIALFDIRKNEYIKLINNIYEYQNIYYNDSTNKIIYYSIDKKIYLIDVYEKHHEIIDLSRQFEGQLIVQFVVVNDDSAIFITNKKQLYKINFTDKKTSIISDNFLKRLNIISYNKINNILYFTEIGYKIIYELNIKSMAIRKLTSFVEDIHKIEYNPEQNTLNVFGANTYMGFYNLTSGTWSIIQVDDGINSYYYNSKSKILAIVCDNANIYLYNILTYGDNQIGGFLPFYNNCSSPLLGQ